MSRSRWILWNLVLLAVSGTGCAPDSSGRGADPAGSGAAAAVEPADRSAAAAEPARSSDAEVDDRPAILFLGTSLTAGNGLTVDEAFPAVVQAKLDSAGLRYRVVNAGVSGETSAGGLRRLDWLLEQPFAVLVLELGANDGLRGHDPEATRANLQEILDRTRVKYPDVAVVIAGMEAPPNMGEVYTTGFRALFPELAAANGAALIPFLLDGVAGVPELNQADGIHPTAEGHRRVAENVWRVLEPVLRAQAERQGGSPARRP